MYQNIIIPMDHGNRNMKTRNFIYTSGLEESDIRPPLGEYLFYRGKYYTLTEKRIPYMRDKTLDERFFILSLFGIGMECERQHPFSQRGLFSVELPVGLPPKHFGSLYQKFENYFRRDGIVDFGFRGKEYRVCIENVVAFPQDYAAAMTVYQDIRSYGRAVVIDLGGFTLDYMLIRGGAPDLAVCDSLEQGVIKLYNQAISRVNSEFDILLDEADIDDIIAGAGADFPAGVAGAVRNMSYTFVGDLIGILRERGLDLNA
jgi:plasmid segregation protein ParM